MCEATNKSLCYKAASGYYNGSNVPVNILFNVLFHLMQRKFSLIYFGLYKKCNLPALGRLQEPPHRDAF